MMIARQTLRISLNFLPSSIPADEFTSSTPAEETEGKEREYQSNEINSLFPLFVIIFSL